MKYLALKTTRVPGHGTLSKGALLAADHFGSDSDFIFHSLVSSYAVKDTQLVALEANSKFYEVTDPESGNILLLSGQEVAQLAQDLSANSIQIDDSATDENQEVVWSADKSHDEIEAAKQQVNESLVDHTLEKNNPHNVTREQIGGFDHYLINVEYTGVETTLPTGLVNECTLKGETYYRFESSDKNANGYSLEDAFYADFDGTTLTNKIVQRG